MSTILVLRSSTKDSTGPVSEGSTSDWSTLRMAHERTSKAAAGLPSSKSTHLPLVSAWMASRSVRTGSFSAATGSSASRSVDSGAMM